MFIKTSLSTIVTVSEEQKEIKLYMAIFMESTVKIGQDCFLHSFKVALGQKDFFFSYLEKGNLSAFVVLLCYTRQLQMQPC